MLKSFSNIFKNPSKYYWIAFES